VKIEEYERLVPTAVIQRAGKTLQFHTPSSFTLWRAKTLFTKEQSTIEWLDRLSPGQHLLDIGANVGGYSVYAAVIRGASVDAVEPEAQNFSILCKNVLLNGIAETVSCWPMGVSDEVGVHKLYISDMRVGGSCHSLNEQVDFNLKEKKFAFSQGCYSTKIDQLVFDKVIRVPDFIKIDVDGLEHKVLSGARETLANKSVRSLSIELNTNLKEHLSAIEYLTTIGFHHDTSQVQRAMRQEGAFKGVAEFIFDRAV
jgi:FkbM family methyltransferase